MAFRLPDAEGKLQSFSFEGRKYLLPVYDTPAKRTLLVFGRQCEKTTSIGNKLLSYSYLRPFLRSLYVSPTERQTTAFSKERLGLPMRTSEYFRHMQAGKDTSDNILYKAFNNNSTITLRYAFLSADSSRGLSADLLAVDESIRVGTLVDTPTGTRPVESFNPGDAIVSFDEKGELHEDEVVACLDHGQRECFRLELSTGAAVELTCDSWVATTAGWKRAADVIIDAYSGRNSAGVDARRYVDGRTLDKEPVYLEQPRVEAAQLQLPKVPGPVRVRPHAAQEAEESRLRGMVECLDESELAGILPYSLLVPAQRQETCDAELGGQANLAEHRALVHGRRQPEWQSNGHVPHAGILPGGSYPAGGRPARAGSRLRSSSCSFQAHCGRVLPRNICANFSDNTPSKNAAPVYFSRDALQGSGSGAARGVDLPLVRSIVLDRWPPCSWSIYKNKTTMLRRFIVPAGDAQRVVATLRVKTRVQGKKEVKCPKKVRLRTFARGKGKTAIVLACLCAEKQGPSSGKKASSTAARTCGEGCASVVVRRLWKREYARSMHGEKEMLRHVCQGPCGGSEAALPGKAHGQGQRSRREYCSAVLVLSRSATIGKEKEESGHLQRACVQNGAAECTTPRGRGRLGVASLTRISCTGVQRVYDLEVRANRTFIAGGVAVHNCQDILWDVIPVLEECISHSPLKLSMYAGTPKSFDNTIGYLWHNFSTQYEWVIPCDACGSRGKGNYRYWNVIGYESIGLKGLICTRCGGQLNKTHPDARWASTRSKEWLANPPASVGIPFESYRIPQPLVQWLNWADILDKKARYGVGQFHNEVLGLSYDSGEKLIRKQALVDQSREHIQLNDLSCIQGKGPLFMGIDWGGGGESNPTSFTDVVIGGYAGDRFVVPFMKRYQGREAEFSVMMADICSLIERYKIHLVGCDYGGGIPMHDELIRRFGVEKIVRYQYTSAKKLYFDTTLTRFMANRTEVMMAVINAVNRMDTFEFPSWPQWESPFGDCFLSLYAEYNASNNTTTVCKTAGRSDDLFHSVVYCLLASMIYRPRPDILTPDKDR